jgi:mannose/fructose/N-acetylgalactosamine-specific phosphotransferase system component IIC
MYMIRDVLCDMCFVLLMFCYLYTSMWLEEVKQTTKKNKTTKTVYMKNMTSGIGSGMANFLPVFTALGLGPSSVPSMPSSLSATTIPT